MIEKRSFLFGLMMGKMSSTDVPEEKWDAIREDWCTKMRMTPPDHQERRECIDFLEYALSVYRRSVA